MATAPASEIIALCCADLHLTLTPPPARAKEDDWLRAQQRPLDEMEALAKKHDVPILCAGDVFDVPDPPIALVNWAIDHLPQMYAVPGQHDLPLHNLDDLHKSVFGTMVKFRRIKLAQPEGSLIDSKFYLFGFAWGEKVEIEEVIRFPHKLKIAIQHAYRWTDGKGHPKAAKEDYVKQHNSSYLAIFDTVVFGDNHVPWESNGFHIFNCGSFYRRKSDETHCPRVGLIHADGTVTPHYLNTEGESFVSTNTPEAPPADPHLANFLKTVRDLETATMDYAQALRFASEKASADVQKIIAKALEAK